MAADDTSQDFERALLAMDRVGARETLAGALRSTDAFGSLESVVTPALERIGREWETGRVALAQLYMAGRIAEQVVSDLLPEGPPATGPRLAIAVLADHHVLGKRLVLSALRAAGYAVTDYGHGLSVQQLVQRCHNERPEVLLISTLMLPSALIVRDVVARLSLPGARPAVIVGGAPFRIDPELWHEVGADAAGRDSAEAIALVRRFTGGDR